MTVGADEIATEGFGRDGAEEGKILEVDGGPERMIEMNK